MLNSASQTDKVLIDQYPVQERKPRLLVVDDQPINIQMLYQIFGADYQVFMATSGQQALAMCQKNLPDLILLDIVMPEMDGFAVCSQLKAQPETEKIPVIFLTALNDAEQETHGLELGAVDFISKPVNPAVVRARVKTHLMLKQQTDLLHQLVFLDGLTGVYNRRYFDQQLEIELARSLRTGDPLSLIMFDIDYFKRYNDHYGHLAGDECLRQIALALKGHLRRPADLLARYGGEEFVCILSETSFEAAMELAIGMEQRVRALQIAHLGSEMSPDVTISLGVTGRSGEAPCTVAALLAKADAQLYRAKAAGRGRVCGEQIA